jgi:hypothetical protein
MFGVDKYSLKLILIFSIIIGAINFSVKAGIICFILSIIISLLVHAIMHNRLPVFWKKKRKPIDIRENSKERYKNLEL